MQTRQSATLVPLNLVHPNPDSPREEPTRDDIVALANSIRRHGLIDPIHVTQHPTRQGHFILLSGRRRYAAAVHSGLTEVPALVRHHVGRSAAVLELLTSALNTKPLTDAELGIAVEALLHTGLDLPTIASEVGCTVTRLQLLLNSSLWEHSVTGPADEVPGATGPHLDELAVVRAVSGDRPGVLTRDERLEAVRRLNAAQLNDEQIAERLGVCSRTIRRDRNTLGVPAVDAQQQSRRAS